MSGIRDRPMGSTIDGWRPIHGVPVSCVGRVAVGDYSPTRRADQLLCVQDAERIIVLDGGHHSILVDDTSGSSRSWLSRLT